MKFSKAREAYDYFSGKASELGRALALSGVAVIWVFRETSTAATSIPKNLYLPGVLFVSCLTFDLLHYAYGTVAWGRYVRKRETTGQKDDDEVTASRWINWPTNTLFTLKLLAVGVGYVLLLKYLVTHLGSGAGCAAPTG